MHLICFTLLADSNELMSMPSSSLFISKVTGRRTPFSRTSRLRLSRGVWRDDILSLDRANWRNRWEKQHRRDEMSVLTRKSDNEYDLCQTDATRINNNVKNSAHWLMRLSLTSQWDKNCLLQTQMKHELQMIPVLLTGRQATVLCQCLFRIIFACRNLWLHKIIHIIPYQ